MPEISLAKVLDDERRQRRRMRWAMLGKEWREQRWRFFLSTVVMTGLLAGLMRAQIISHGEAALLIYWPVGCLMVVFLAMGSVAVERAERTWEFLIAQPISRADVLATKWAVGAAQLVGMYVIATIAGLLAIWSRQPATLIKTDDTLRTWLEGVGKTPLRDAFAEALSTVSPMAWVAWIALVAVCSMLCLYTLIFFVLTRARNEFTAGLGGVFAMIVVHLWLLQIFPLLRGEWLWLPSAAANPLVPLVLSLLPQTRILAPFLLPLYLFVWVYLLLKLARRWAGRVAKV